MQVSILLLSSNVKDFLTMIRDEREADIYRLIVGSKLRFPKARSAGLYRYIRSNDKTMYVSIVTLKQLFILTRSLRCCRHLHNQLETS